MARCAHARRALCDAEPDQELGLRTWRRRRTRPGHRCQHRHFLGGQYGVASAARLPRRRAPRLGRDVVDQHRARQPGRVRSRLSRLAGAERRVREDGRVLRWRRFPNHRRRPRHVCQPPVRLGRFLCGLRPDRVGGTPADGAGCPGRATRSRRSPSWRITGQWHTSAATRPRSGRRSRLYGNPLEIVGVAAPGFRYPGAADLWVPWLTTNGGHEPQPAQLPGRREAQAGRGPHACAGRRCGPLATVSRGSIRRIA